jgi:hypothetical protein
MAVRPTDCWRAGIAEEENEVASGTLDPECAVMARLYPESLLVRTDEVLSAFDAEVGAFSDPSDDQIFDAVEHVILALNTVNAEHDGTGYETGEREALCLYIDGTLEEAGIDVAALAARHGLSRYTITDRWRRW